MSLKIEDVKAGDELVCIDFKGLADHRCDYMPQWLDDLMLSPIIVSNVKIDRNIVYFRNDSRYLEISDLKYFKKKEQSQQYTLDDLIDGARKAFKDVKIFSFGVTDCAVGIKLLDKSEKIFTLMDICNGVEFIQSLYKETFVIELEDDCKRIKQRAKITFLNGNSIVMDQPPVGDGIVRIWNDGRYDFTVLKGATVEQERGRDDCL